MRRLPGQSPARPSSARRNDTRRTDSAAGTPAAAPPRGASAKPWLEGARPSPRRPLPRSARDAGARSARDPGPGAARSLDRQVGVDDDRRLAAANPLVDLDRAEADRRAGQERIRHQRSEFHQLAHLGQPRQLPTDQEVVEDVREREAASDMAADAAPEQVPPLPDAGGDRQFLAGARQLPELGPRQRKELAALVGLRLGWPDEDPLGALRRRRLEGERAVVADPRELRPLAALRQTVKNNSSPLRGRLR